jgi:hypothetical protein
MTTIKPASCATDPPLQHCKSGRELRARLDRSARIRINDQVIDA